MKETPSVCAIMLVNGREELVKRAIKSFREQTYQKKRLLIYDTTPGENRVLRYQEGVDIVDEWPTDERSMPYSIGRLRNKSNGHSEEDILCHFDSDDWSHPRRIEEQVALLQASGKQCVGYRDMLFWDTTPGQFCGAWLYRHPTKPLGTSLCYWRSVWEQRPFEDLPKAKGGTGEDVKWLEGVEHLGITSFAVMDEISWRLPLPPTNEKPRMIASIHGGNTQYYNPAESEELSGGTSWKRAPEWDGHCKLVMAP